MTAETERLRTLLANITSLTRTGELHWERQVNSAHRYARWKNHLLILGPDTLPGDKETTRYLFITPFDSPDCIEVCSNDAASGPAVLSLVEAVESQTTNEPPADPFALTDDFLSRLNS